MLKWLYSFFRKRYAVSVVIPTYKNTVFLIECLESVMLSARKCCQYEILLGIDNCKETLDFVGKHELFKNKNIKVYYFSKNVGPYIIRNSLAGISKYDNILFFDSDDIMMPHMLETIMGKSENSTSIKFKFYNFYDNLDHNDISNLSLSQMFSQGAFFIKKKEFIKMNGFYGWKCGADTEFQERWEGTKQDTLKLDIPLFYRRYHDSNITRTPETGPDSKLREKYGRFILDNRINGKWKNPEKPAIFKANLVIL